MYNIIPLILILISLAAIIIIIARKFSALASLDVNAIPEEKEARFKEQILSNRLKRNVIKWSSKIGMVISAINGKSAVFFKWALGKLHDIKNDYQSKAPLREEEKKSKVDLLFEEMEKLDSKEDFEDMEKKLIAVIGMQSNNLEAFEMLGDLYFEAKKYIEAGQTYEYILNFLQDGENPALRAKIYFNLALINKAQDDLDGALKQINKSLEMEVNNPRYLDTALEISIIKKDKRLALDFYEKLSAANPENRKLEELRKEIEEI